MEPGKIQMQMDTLEYRQTRLREKLHRMERILSGRNSSFLRQVRDETGRYDETRARALAERLIAALADYRGARGGGGVAPADEALYRSFLYCAIRYAECPPKWDSPWFDLPEAHGIYEDLLLLAESLSPVEKMDLYFFEYQGFGLPCVFFAAMDELYGMISPTPIQDSISGEDRALVEEVRQKELAWLEEMAEEEAGLPESVSAGEAYQAYWDSLTPEERAAEDELAEECAADALREKAAKADWMAAFQEKETFCREYLLLRSAYFDAPSRKTLGRDVGHMLDMLLFRENLSHYLNDDVFFSAMALLDQTVGETGRLLAGGR